LYIAYGSNLHIKGMRSRCPDARPVGRIVLDNARLVFRGVADVAYEAGHTVPCGLWRISREDETFLDRYEGVRAGLYDKEYITVDGEEALIYTMTATGIFPPADFYVGTIRQGYRDFGLDLSCLNEAIRYSFDRKDPCEMTLARRERQRKSEKYSRLVKVPESVAMARLARRVKREIAS
jgi:hypothetical protein